MRAAFSRPSSQYGDDGEKPCDRTSPTKSAGVLITEVAYESGEEGDDSDVEYLETDQHPQVWYYYSIMNDSLTINNNISNYNRVSNKVVNSKIYQH